MTTKIRSDQALVFWDAKRILRATVEDAFGKATVNPLRHIPKVDHFAALKHAAKEVADAVGLRSTGKRLTYMGLAHDRNAVGIEVRRLVKGRSRNNLPFLFSLGVTEVNGVPQVVVLDIDATNAPEIQDNSDEVAKAATRLFHDQCNFLTANDLTSAIVSLIKSLGAVMLRDGGVIWGLPIDHVQEIRAVAEKLGECGASLVVGVFDPVVNDDLVSHVATQVTDRATNTLDAMIREIEELKSRDAKPRASGTKTRMEKLMEVELSVNKMKSVLGNTYVALCKAVNKAREAIGAAARAEMSNVA